jgi:hypothetical protein
MDSFAVLKLIREKESCKTIGISDGKIDGLHESLVMSSAKFANGKSENLRTSSSMLTVCSSVIDGEKNTVSGTVAIAQSGIKVGRDKESLKESSSSANWSGIHDKDPTSSLDKSNDSFLQTPHNSSSPIPSLVEDKLHYVESIGSESCSSRQCNNNKKPQFCDLDDLVCTKSTIFFSQMCCGLSLDGDGLILRKKVYASRSTQTDQTILNNMISHRLRRNPAAPHAWWQTSMKSEEKILRNSHSEYLKVKTRGSFKIILDDDEDDDGKNIN